MSADLTFRCWWWMLHHFVYINSLLYSTPYNTWWLRKVLWIINLSYPFKFIINCNCTAASKLQPSLPHSKILAGVPKFNYLIVIWLQPTAAVQVQLICMHGQCKDGKHKLREKLILWFQIMHVNYSIIN